MRIFYILLLFSINCFSQQYESDCEKFFKSEKDSLQKFRLKELKNKSKFESLKNIIFDGISKKDLLSDNIDVAIFSNTFINDNISNCKSKSTLYFDKSSILDSLFWNKNTFEFLRQKYHKNFFPTINYNGGIHLTEKLLSDNKFEYIKKFPKVYSKKDKSDIYYFPIKEKLPLKITSGNSASRIIVNFGHYESKNLVLVEVISFGQKITRISKSYIFENGKWKLEDCLKLINSSKVDCN